jgi:hypothetical protein
MNRLFYRRYRKASSSVKPVTRFSVTSYQVRGGGGSPGARLITFTNINPQTPWLLSGLGARAAVEPKIVFLANQQ